MQWRPTASIETLKIRAQFMKDIRAFFEARGYLEVETPYMAAHGITDVYLANIEATFRNKPYQLQTSPEYHMKRLLAAGSGPIYQLARVFRDDELGRWHNPEFTLLEWYQLRYTHHDLIKEMDEFLQAMIQCQPLVKMTYEQAFIESCDLNPFTATIADLKHVLHQHALDYVLPPDEQDPDQYLFLLMSHIVEPYLGKKPYPIAVYDFPPSQASLARLNDGRAARFEVYYQGVELANGFYELTDVQAQIQRFEEDLNQRQSKGFSLPSIDNHLLDAMRAGIPDCSGVALGVDRLLALKIGAQSLSEVLSFDVSRA